MSSRPQSVGVLGKASDSGRHPLQPVPDAPTTPPPAPPAAPAATTSNRVVKMQGTWRVPVDLLDRLDAYVTPERKRAGEGKEVVVAAALDEYLTARGA